MSESRRLLETDTINATIVYTSFAIMVIAALTCGIVFCVKAKRRNPASDLPEKVSEVVTEKTKSTKAKKVSTKQKKGNKKSKRIKDADGTESHSSYESGSYASSETSSLLTDANNESKAEAHAGTMNKALRATFNSVLSEGLTLIMHSADQPMIQVRMTLIGSELRWRSKKVFSTKSYKLNLNDVKFIEWGKQTETFKLPSCKNAKDEACFSLVTDKATYDFETSSKVERDALVQGFMLAVSDLKSSNSKV